MMYVATIIIVSIHLYIRIYIAGHLCLLIQLLTKPVHLPITVTSAKHTNCIPTCKMYFDSDFLL